MRNEALGNTKGKGTTQNQTKKEETKCIREVLLVSGLEQNLPSTGLLVEHG